MKTDIPNLEEIRSGGKQAMARALAAVERLRESDAIADLLDSAHNDPKAFVVGFTGPPGVGKSTLVNAIIKKWRQQNLTVGVIAVDPSSLVTGGALLGDRTRMTTDPEDDGVFVRSLASRGNLGGLTELAYPVMTLMRAIYDRVIVETVGVGQSEAEISSVADTVVLCVQPGSGDSLQFMKAGIMEIPDIAVVTKADFGQKAERAVGEMQGALSLTVTSSKAWKIPVQAVSSTTGEGLTELLEKIDAHRQYLIANELLEDSRRKQAGHWLTTALATKYGVEGLKAVSVLLGDGHEASPFTVEKSLTARIKLSVLND